MDGNFQFISIRTPDDAKDRATRRLARSHAVRQALGNKRRQQQLSGDVFLNTVVNDPHSEKKRKDRSVGGAVLSLSIPPAGILDPFQALAVDSSRLQVLLGDYRARKALEPVVSVAEELAFQSFRSVFNAGFDDPALVNAVMLSLAFAVTGSIDSECLRYQGQAVAYIRERMDSLAEATSEATIGAILLLTGVVARLGLTSQVEMHMGAVHRLLRICQARGVYLTPGIKRAIFWQDLNSSILAGSTRAVDHTTFSELLWARDPFVPSFYRLPSGLDSRSDLFTKEFIDILQDLNGLHCIRESGNARKRNAMFMLNVNNYMASVQSRLEHLSGLSELQECCRLAAYLCAAMVCCTVWCELVIPLHISSELLRKLQNAGYSILRAEHPQLLAWLLHIGGAFAPIGPLRSGYLNLLRSADGSLPYKLWPELHRLLKQFIWSDKAFMTPVRALWEEAFM